MSARFYSSSADIAHNRSLLEQSANNTPYKQKLNYRSILRLKILDNLVSHHLRDILLLLYFAGTAAFDRGFVLGDFDLFRMVLL